MKLPIAKARKARSTEAGGRARSGGANLSTVFRSVSLKSYRFAFLTTMLAVAFAACGAPKASNRDDDPGSNGDDDSDDLDVGDGPRGTGSTGGLCSETGTCSCIRLALFGTLDSKAIDKDTSAFVEWLNASSEGTAEVTMFVEKPAVDAVFLASYDILIVANVNAWTFSDSDKQAVATWVREVGGGVLTLTGFTSEESEPQKTSDLISFSGISYGQTKVAEQGQNLPIYYRGGSENLRNCLVRNGVSSNDAVITTPIAFAASGDETIKANLSYVGAYIGWEVIPPAGAAIVVPDPTTARPILVATQVGLGRVFAFGDEWVIFANQWIPDGTPTNTQMDEHNQCWVPAGESPSGTAFFHSVSSLYQTKQFWYNAVSWLAPGKECFVVTDEEVIL